MPPCPMCANGDHDTPLHGSSVCGCPCHIEASTNNTDVWVPGQLAMLTIDKLQVLVRIVELKRSYGRARAIVTPVTGAGYTLIDMQRLSTL